MTIFESLQGLSFDTKALIAIMAILWGLSELRHVLRHRADQYTIQRLQTEEASAEHATLEVHRLSDVPRGAGLTLGEMVPRGAEAGQHFVGAIKNTGPQAAEAIQVTASLGTIKADVVAAPRRLPPHSAAAAVDVRLPFGFLTSANVMAALRSGEILHIRVAFSDGSPKPREFEQCFDFAPEHGDEASGADWVSRRVSCP